MAANVIGYFRRPLSTLSCILAVLLIIYEIIQIARGHLYLKALGGIDGTTLIELGILALYGLFALRTKTDLQAASFTLVSGLSFIFLYEAIYKWSFYLFPFRGGMPPQELRQLVIQLGIALSVLTGFAVGFFALKRWTLIWLGVFVALWLFWLLLGFPQFSGRAFWPAVIPISASPALAYIINRATKTVLFFAYLTLFPTPHIQRTVSDER